MKLKKHWGIEQQLDLCNCDPSIIRSSNQIKTFVKELCNLIEMKRFGKTVVVNFGEDPKVSGYSMTQLIETSLISGHFANQSNSCYINVFSCKDFDPKKVKIFCKHFFKCKEIRSHITYRGNGI